MIKKSELWARLARSENILAMITECRARDNRRFTGYIKERDAKITALQQEVIEEQEIFKAATGTTPLGMLITENLRLYPSVKHKARH